MNELSELRNFVKAVLRMWWLILLVTGIAAGAAYFRTRQQEPVYEATVSVIIGQSLKVTDPDGSDIETSDRLAYTYSLIIRRQPIMQGTVDALGLDESWRELRSKVDVYLVPLTPIIEITAQASSPEKAQRIADEIAQQLIRLSPTAFKDDDLITSKQFVRSRVRSLQEKIERGLAQIDQLEATMIAAEEQDEKRALNREIEALESVVSSWENNFTRYLAFVENEESSNIVSIIEPAQARGSPVSPDIRTNTLLAGGLGLLLALAIVFILEYVDDTLKTEEDLELALNLAPLGTVTQMKGKNGLDKLINSHKPFSPASEQYRIIRSNIQFMSVDEQFQTMVVTSAGPGEGKSVTSANLAMVMAQAGLKTILVDADLRQPEQHKFFRLSNQEGLTDLLRPSQIPADKARISEHLKNIPVKDMPEDQLRVLTSGPLPPNPSELLGSKRIEQVLNALKDMADVVILDTMPVLPVVDAVVLANRVDGVVFVVEAGRSRRVAVRKALQKLTTAGAHVWGGVLNRVPAKKDPYFRHGYVPAVNEPHAG